MQDPLSYLFGLEQFGIKFGLHNIQAICARLGHPERAFRSVHVAGTNGKGSVTAMVDAALRAAGHRTGRYTSPHLVRLNERFAVDGHPIEDAELLDTITSVRRVVDALVGEHVLDTQPTFFEVTTAAAFEWFRRASVELAVIEVGLGGRLDATNVITPEVTAITSIAFDHQLYLGTSLASIAREKAGIIKRGVPVVVGDVDSEARAVIDEVAAANGAPVIKASAADVENLEIGLPGAHQRGNAAVAMKLLACLEDRGVAIGRDAVVQALSRTQWAGRLDLRRLADGREILMDAAHNAAGAEALAKYLESLPGGRVPLVFAAMRDKDATTMFRALLPAVSGLILTRAENPRSAAPDDLARVARDVAPSLSIDVAPALPDALELGWRTSTTNRIVVAGSIFLLGDVLRRLGLNC
ncbi:MAG TPA: folylpolyglutamate synthase/dihydrofolate synthase family protein [Vicinamibacterales bacterium]